MAQIYKSSTRIERNLKSANRHRDRLNDAFNHLSKAWRQEPNSLNNFRERINGYFNKHPKSCQKHLLDLAESTANDPDLKDLHAFIIGQIIDQYEKLPPSDYKLKNSILISTFESCARLNTMDQINNWVLQKLMHENNDNPESDYKLASTLVHYNHPQSPYYALGAAYAQKASERLADTDPKKALEIINNLGGTMRRDGASPIVQAHWQTRRDQIKALL